ncbi:MAG: patatin-like phospholipase family protein [Synergistaceae bacterium]|nr:patatin-like phospholipase family protein [Synergistaceae bacterium]
MKKKIISLFLLSVFLVQPSLTFASEERLTTEEFKKSVEQDDSTILHGDKASTDPCNWGFPHNKGVVLVLCGGGMKGLAHVGVLEVLEREHIPIAAIVGTSMGAIIGGLYACGYTSSELKDILGKTNFMKVISGRGSEKEEAEVPGRLPLQKKRPFSWDFDFNNTKQATNLGMLNDRDFFLYLQNLVSQGEKNNFNLLKYPFAAIATNLLNGQTTAFRKGSLASAIRASMSLPVVYAPWEIDGQLYIDGGLKANLPVLQAKELFPGHPILAINLANTTSLKPEDIKNNIDVAMASITILMDIKQQENIKAADLVITPDLHGIQTLSDRPPDEIVEYGKEAAEAHLADIKQLVSTLAEHVTLADAEKITQKQERKVTELHFYGANDRIEHYLKTHYEGMIGKPLDMTKITRAIADLTSKFEIKSANVVVRDLDDGSVALDFKLVFPAPYEFYIDGFASNTYVHRWLALGLARRNLLYPNDKLNLETRMGTEWGIFLDYDTPQGFEKTNWSLFLGAQEEHYDNIHSKFPGFAPFIYDYSINRYTARLMYQYKFNERLSMALGYQAQAISTDQKYIEQFENKLGIKDLERVHGPMLSLTYNHVDDVALPTRGLKFSSLMWYGVKEDFWMSRSALNVYIPAFKWGQIVLNAGLKTGDSSQPAFGVLFGADNELYSLGQTPISADQAYWVHFGIAKKISQSWWGGLQAEIFSNYGETLENWHRFFSQWEVGLALTVPLMTLSGKLYVVYDQKGGFTFGYTFGMPRFRHGF